MVRMAAAAALVLPLTALAACADAPTPARATPPPVRIGAIYNLTGDQASLDSSSLDGARLAVERINAHGGLMGRRVELLERDGQTNETDVRRAAASLVASGVSAIVGLSDTDQVLAAAPIAASAGVPFVTSGATSPRLTRQVPNWLFLACFGDNAQAAASAQYATDRLGARTAAVLYDRDLDYTRLLAKYFERSFRAQGGQVLVSADYGKDESAVDRLRGKGAGDGRRATGGKGGSSDGDSNGDGSDGGDGSGGESDGSSDQESSDESEGSTSTTLEATTTRTRPTTTRHVGSGGDRRRAVRRRRPRGRGGHRAPAAPRRATGSRSWAATASTRRRSSRPPRRPAARSTTPRTRLWG